MRRLRIQLDAVGVGVFQDMSRIFHNGKLHAQAEAQEREIVGAGIFDGRDFSLNAAAAETAGNKNAVHIAQKLCHIIRGHRLGIHPFDVDNRVAGDAAVLQCFHHTDVSVMQRDIFSDQGNGHFAGGMLQGVYHIFPVFHIRLRAVQLQALAGNLGQVLLFHGQRCLIQIFHVQVLQHVRAGHIAEQGDLVLDALIHGHL